MSEPSARVPLLLRSRRSGSASAAGRPPGTMTEHRLPADRSTDSVPSCFPPHGKHDQVVARPTGNEALSVETPLVSPSRSVQVVGTGTSTWAFVHPKGFKPSSRRCSSLAGRRLTLPQPAVASPATRDPQEHLVNRRNGKVASDVDQKVKWPRRPALDKPGGATVAEGPCSGGPVGLPHTLSAKDGDVIRVPVPARTHTAPRRGVSSRGCWSFDGVFVLSARTPVRTSAEGAGMT